MLEKGIDDWFYIPLLLARSSDKERHPTLSVRKVPMSDDAMLIRPTYKKYPAIA